MPSDETAKPPAPSKAKRRKPKAEASTAKPPKPSKNFVTWKLRIQEAVICDKRMSAQQVRLFLFVLHKTDHRSNDQGHADGVGYIAIVPDQAISDDLPGFADDETLRRNKLHIDELGWWTRIPGRGLKGTIYAPQVAPIEGVMSLIRQNRITRKESHVYRIAALKAGTETLEQQHQVINEKRGKSIKRSPQNTGKNHRPDEGISRTLSRSEVTQRAISTSQDVAQGSRLPEVLDSPVCTDCGKPAVVAGRAHGQGPIYPFCRECADFSSVIDGNRIAANGNSERIETTGIEPDDGYRFASGG